jgi:hypothetical protein
MRSLGSLRISADCGSINPQIQPNPHSPNPAGRVPAVILELAIRPIGGRDDLNTL